jgi:hypothetical protein
MLLRYEKHQLFFRCYKDMPSIANQDKSATRFCHDSSGGSMGPRYIFQFLFSEKPQN